MRRSHWRSACRQRLFRSGIALLGLLVVSCAAEVKRTDLDEALLEAESGLTPTEASCIVDELVAIYGMGGLQDEMNRDIPTVKFGTSQANSHLRCGATEAYEQSISATLIEDGATIEQAQCTTSMFVASLGDADIAHIGTGAEWESEPIYHKWIDALEACGLWP